MSAKRLTLGLAILAASAFAQTPAPAAAPAAPAAPTPLTTPAITGPLSQQLPATFDAGPFGTLDVNGVVSGMGLLQSNHVPGDDNKQASLSNGQLFIQKTDGWFQFYVQAGAYNISALGLPYLSAETTTSALYGPLPVAYIKLQAGKNTSIEIGKLPTLIGAEYTFSFENMNVERGLLWNQETAVSRGIQLNQAMGKFAASVSWNDGFYSGRYSWISGSLAYTNGPNAISFVAGGNLGQTAYETYATPVQNNGAIYNVIYTFTKGPWIIQPYYQYTDVGQNTKLGIPKGTSTNGGAILLSYAFKNGFSIPIRYEMISSSGNAKDGSLNLLFGPGSTGTSFTVTPTFQKAGFFLRGDMGWAHAGSYTSGDVFGQLGTKNNQIRVVAEIGFIFGDNITKKP